MVELIADLRGIPKGSSAFELAAAQQGTPALFFGGTKQEEFYMRLGGALCISGFNRSEHLLPAGTPYILHQPVYRFRSEKEDRRSVLYQVGYGIFSVHAIPPISLVGRILAFRQDCD